MSHPERRRPTIEDVAREADVSRATVSRVLNGGVWVSDDAAERVRRAIKKTGYRINAHARSLATRRAGSVALLLTESHERFFEDPNFSLIMRSASTALAERELQLLLILADTAVEQRRAVDFMTAGHVDGALLVSGHRDHLDFLDDLLSAEVPITAVGAPLGFEKRVAYVPGPCFAGCCGARAGGGLARGWGWVVRGPVSRCARWGWSTRSAPGWVGAAGSAARIGDT